MIHNISAAARFTDLRRRPSIALLGASSSTSKSAGSPGRPSAPVPPPSEIALGENEKPVDAKTPLPARGCNVELTRVSVGTEVWWTLGFEAFGKLETIESDPRAVAQELARRNPPALGDAIRASYPLWLGRYLKAAAK